MHHSETTGGHAETAGGCGHAETAGGCAERSRASTVTSPLTGHGVAPLPNNSA
ncbi:MAG: hypothetical protein LBD24_04855 [Spirochaetaceae bacterium]|nr:hypothetical protein [Spirochaetaceae bacterium]